MEKVVYNLQSVYRIPNMRVVGNVCQTNLPSNTTMNGFGGPQALFIMEHILSHIAYSLELGKDEVQEINLLKNDDCLDCALQGLDTKIIQVCAECLDIPAELIHINEPCTDKIMCFTNSNLIAMAVQV